MVYIQVKNYEHFNRAMGKQITSKAHYEKEMIAGGYVPFEKAEQMAEQARARQQKKYDGLTPETIRFLHQVKDTADRKGNIKISDRFVKGLQEHKVLPKDLNYYSKLPSSYEKGGFE